MTRRTINQFQFWLTFAFLLLPGLAFWIAWYVRFESGLLEHASVSSRPYFVFTVLITAFWAFAVERLGLNRISTILALRTGVNTAARACGLCALLVLSIVFFYRSVTFARIFVILGLALLLVFSIFLVHVLRRILYSVDMSHNGRFRIAVLGTDEYGLRVARHLADNEAGRCRVACFIALPGQPQTIEDAPVLPWDKLDDVVEVFHCSEILICLAPDQIGHSHDIVKPVRNLCIPARIVMNLGEGIFVPDRVFEYYGIPLLDIRPCPVDTIAYSLGKRVFDICFASVVLLLASPLFALIAIIIKLTSSGPVFFAQERVGLSGQSFYIYKFRTMVTSSELSSETQWTTQHDSRVTPFGAVLRRTSLDELPQFFNVLRGEMSVVGPRPERPYFVHKFLKEVSRYSVRHSLKVGITGWAQVNGWRGDTSIEKRIQYDLYYLENWSFSLDVKIILMTLMSGLVAGNAY